MKYLINWIKLRKINICIDVDVNDELSTALSEYGLSNLYEVLKKHSISADNILVIGEDTLREWNVSENDILTYKRKTLEYQGKHYLPYLNDGSKILFW